MLFRGVPSRSEGRKATAGVLRATARRLSSYLVELIRDIRAMRAAAHPDGHSLDEHTLSDIGIDRRDALWMTYTDHGRPKRDRDAP